MVWVGSFLLLIHFLFLEFGWLNKGEFVWVGPMSEPKHKANLLTQTKRTSIGFPYDGPRYHHYVACLVKPKHFVLGSYPISTWIGNKWTGKFPTPIKAQYLLKTCPQLFKKQKNNDRFEQLYIKEWRLVVTR